MAIAILIIGGAAGGFLGWLFDRKTGRARMESYSQPDKACETRT
jgi:hypothetical protein